MALARSWFLLCWESPAWSLPTLGYGQASLAELLGHCAWPALQDVTTPPNCPLSLCVTVPDVPPLVLVLVIHPS